MFSAYPSGEHKPPTVTDARSTLSTVFRSVCALLGAVVCVVGDAGVGKSAAIAALLSYGITDPTMQRLVAMWAAVAADGAHSVTGTRVSYKYGRQPSVEVQFMPKARWLQLRCSFFARWLVKLRSRVAAKDAGACPGSAFGELKDGDLCERDMEALYGDVLADEERVAALADPSTGLEHDLPSIQQLYADTDKPVKSQTVPRFDVECMTVLVQFLFTWAVTPAAFDRLVSPTAEPVPVDVAASSKLQLLVDFVTVALPLPVLESGVTVVDCPGGNDVRLRRDDSECAEASGVATDYVYVSEALARDVEAQPRLDGQVQHALDHAARFGRDSVLFVCTKTDVKYTASVPWNAIGHVPARHSGNPRNDAKTRVAACQRDLSARIQTSLARIRSGLPPDAVGVAADWFPTVLAVSSFKYHESIGGDDSSGGGGGGSVAVGGDDDSGIPSLAAFVRGRGYAKIADLAAAAADVVCSLKAVVECIEDGAVMPRLLAKALSDAISMVERCSTEVRDASAAGGSSSSSDAGDAVPGRCGSGSLAAAQSRLTRLHLTLTPKQLADDVTVAVERLGLKSRGARPWATQLRAALTHRTLTAMIAQQYSERMVLATRWNNIFDIRPSVAVLDTSLLATLSYAIPMINEVVTAASRKALPPGTTPVLVPVPTDITAFVQRYVGGTSAKLWTAGVRALYNSRDDRLAAAFNPHEYLAVWDVCYRQCDRLHGVGFTVAVRDTVLSHVTAGEGATVHVGYGNGVKAALVRLAATVNEELRVELAEVLTQRRTRVASALQRAVIRCTKRLVSRTGAVTTNAEPVKAVLQRADGDAVLKRLVGMVPRGDAPTGVEDSQ